MKRTFTFLLTLFVSACAPKPSATTTVAPDADHLVISPPFDAQLPALSLYQEGNGFRTDIRGEDTSREPRRDVHLTIVHFKGPGEYPFGFAWDRGDTRASVEGFGTRCMTPKTSSGAVTITEGPADGLLAVGARLSGTFRILCSDDAGDGPRREFNGRFSMARRER